MKVPILAPRVNASRSALVVSSVGGSMRFLLVLLLAGYVLVERLPSSTKPFAPLTLVDEFNRCVQERLLNATPGTLGMSRIMIRPSLGQHFAPMVTDKRDFAPEGERESRVL